MDRYRKIIGKTKVEVLKELGDEFNFFPNNVWTYSIKNKWWQKKKTLYVFFEHDIVKNITIK